MQIHSIGVDIGTTTTQLIISRLTIENDASAFTVPHIKIVAKEIIYRSGVHFTPFLNATDIDGDGVLAILRAEFAAAGFRPEEIATGAVIITGEAARKRNADLVLEKMSTFSGQFVVSTAGADLESIIAGKGSGAYAYSMAHHCRAVNADIGGGTTNIVLFFDGEAEAYCCLDIGGRQVRVDEAGRIDYVSPSAAIIAQTLHLPLQEGDVADAALLTQLSGEMAELIFAQIFLTGREALLEKIRTAGSSAYLGAGAPDAVFLSGGVADCVVAPQDTDFPYGDIGNLLGRSIRNSAWFAMAPIQHSAETLRATVVGAGVHLVSISGSTISFTPGLLPIRNIPVLKLNDAFMAAWVAGDRETAAEKLRWFRKATDSEHVALAFTGQRRPTYWEIKQLSAAIYEVYARPEFQDLLLILVVENDMAKALGQALRILFGDGRKMICFDGVATQEGDYIDLGNPMMHDMVIPVVVKTLLIG